MALGWTDRDPTAGVKAYTSREIHTWNEQEISVFEKRWPEGSRERLAFALLLYTGQRGSDVHRMSWTDIVGDTIRVAQRKTAAKLSIPIHDALQRLLAIATNHDQTILATAYGKPFSVKGFGNMMSRAIGEAGLPHAASRMVCGRQRRDVSPKQDVQRVKSWRLPDTKLWPKWSATPVRQSRSDWQDRRSRDNTTTKAANLHSIQWQTQLMSSHKSIA